MATGAGALRSIGWASEPNVSTKLIVHDLHDHLAGRDRLDDRNPDGALLGFVGEGAGDIERNIGLDQRPPHFLQRRIDVGFRQRPAPGQPVEDRIQTLGKTVEHYRPFRRFHLIPARMTK